MWSRPNFHLRQPGDQLLLQRGHCRAHCWWDDKQHDLIKQPMKIMATRPGSDKERLKVECVQEGDLSS
jgi:hypothetical protein